MNKSINEVIEETSGYVQEDKMEDIPWWRRDDIEVRKMTEEKIEQHWVQVPQDIKNYVLKTAKIINKEQQIGWKKLNNEELAKSLALALYLEPDLDESNPID